jgi:hypothetical protein
MKRPSNKTLLIGAAALAAIGFAATRPAHASSPTNVPSTKQARTELAGLTVAKRTHASTYRAGLFPVWDIVSGNCDVKETVIKRDGHGVETDSQCRATSGTWKSAYDGAFWLKSGQVAVDEVVPLKNAWESGAWAWSDDQREKFANDLKDPQLIAVTDDLVRLKGSKSPDVWKPPFHTYYCTYAKAYTHVKSVWKLSVTSEEKDALDSMLDSC